MNKCPTLRIFFCVVSITSLPWLQVGRGQSSERRDLGIIKSCEAPVCIIRAGQTSCAPAKRGNTLQKNDKLRVESNGKATVRCYCPPPISEPNTTAQYEGIPCPTSCPRTLGLNSALLTKFRPEANTLLIPQLSFLDVSEKSYVTISAYNEKWSGDLTKMSVDLPKQDFVMTEGNIYALSVVDNKRVNQNIPALNISPLSAHDSEMVGLIENEIRNMDLPAKAEQFRLAELYVTWGLNIEALPILDHLQFEKDEESDVDPVEIELTLGDVYLSIGDPAGALKKYSKAYASSHGNERKEGYALLGTGQAWAMLGNLEKANAQFFKAIAVFQKMGAMDLVDKAQTLLRPTNRQIQ